MWVYILPTNTCFWIACPANDLESYKKIYEIKKRSLDKALAFLCPSFDYLKDNTYLTDSQINFLNQYKRPFTILIDIESIKDENLKNIVKNLPNYHIYRKLGFRVCHNFMQIRLVQKNWILFLTSANKSWKPEIFNTREIRREFKKEIDDYEISVFAHLDYEIKSSQKSSDVFQFIWNSLDFEFLRRV